MALNITGNIQISGGITISSAYARLTADINQDGDRLRTMVNYYVSKDAYTNGSGEIYLLDSILPVYDYNRQADGADLLDVAHNKVKAELEALGYSVVIEEL
jgi:hypothetical protein